MTVRIEQTPKGRIVHVGGALAWLLARLSHDHLERLERFASALLREEPRPLESQRTSHARERAFEERQMPNPLEAARQGRCP